MRSLCEKNVWSDFKMYPHLKKLQKLAAVLRTVAFSGAAEQSVGVSRGVTYRPGSTC